MVIGDLLNLDMLKSVIEVPFLGSLWTHGDSGMMTPFVCEESFGDGMQLLTVSTINQRPNYHVVRVDSRWNQSNWADGDTVGDHIDEVLTAIEEECGIACDILDEECPVCMDQRCTCAVDVRAAFPALDDESGCSWGHIRWPWLMKSLGITAQIERLSHAS